MFRSKLSYAGRDRVASLWDGLRAAFGAPAASAMALGVLLGLGVSELDERLAISLPLFEFATREAARSLLETIATSTVAVAGISFSVTIVAFTLSANQLSPRVLRSFRRDPLSQITLAAFLGTFIFCITALVRLGADGGSQIPNLSVTLAVLLALLSFGLFAVFIGHIASMLQPSSIIASIAADARSGQRRLYPLNAGSEPEDPRAAVELARRTMGAGAPKSVRCENEGYLTVFGGRGLIEMAVEHNGLIRQCKQVGEFVLPGQAVLEVWGPEGEVEEMADLSRRHFGIGAQRTLPQDPGFPVRQLSDVALKGLSPGVNDPTTALTALEAMTAGLIRFARAEPCCPVRVDEDGQPRLLVTARITELLEELGREATEQGISRGEVDRQLAFLRTDPGEAAAPPVGSPARGS